MFQVCNIPVNTVAIDDTIRNMIKSFIHKRVSPNCSSVAAHIRCGIIERVNPWENI